jgi:hypothetical protein
VLADIGARRAQHLRVRRAAALIRRHLQLEDTFAHQRPRHVGFHLLQEPFDQPADFGALEGVFRQKPAIALQHAMGSSTYSEITIAPQSARMLSST